MPYSNSHEVTWTPAGLTLPPTAAVVGLVLDGA